MTKFQKEILKAKKLFNIKETNTILNLRISNVVNAQLSRDNNYKYETIHTICYDLFYLLDQFINDYPQITPFQRYKIFRICLWGLDELLFFNDTIGTSKNYSYRKVIERIEKVRPFILNYDINKIKIPKAPNDTYNDIYFELINKYGLEKDDTLNLLSCVYGVEKKAKPPKRTIKELKDLKDIFYRIVKGGGKEKGYTKKEIDSKLKEIDKKFKDYL